MYLNCKTYFSFRYGTFGTEELVKHAAKVGANCIAITNINNTCDAWDFVSFCNKENIKPVAGTEIRNDGLFLYILLAKNNNGFFLINHFISNHLQRGIPFPQRPAFDSDVWIIYASGTLNATELTEDELIGVQPHEVNKLFGTNAAAHPDKYVVRQPVTYSDQFSYNLHRLLRAIDKNILITQLSEKDKASTHESFKTREYILSAFEQYPFIISNTQRILDSCSIELEFGKDKNKKAFGSSAEADKRLLEQISMKGFYERYGENNKKAYDRVIKELRIIDELGFNAYFLITWDIIRFAQNKGFFYVGRGSGANSIIAYCLHITDVNPIDLDLYFERFLNPYRATPPDFDIDFSWKDRDEVINYVFQQYGNDHVTLLGMYTTFQKNAIIRELGKVFGLPKSEIDQLVNNRHNSFEEDSIQKKIIRYGSQLKDFPNHLSIHPGGMLISEEPINRYTAVELPPKGFKTSQIDMFIAENIGLYKLDILSQRGLGHIKETMSLVKMNRNQEIDIHNIQHFITDKKIAGKIRNADTIGCFYIESPGMRQLLKKLKCDDYLTLVAASSIIRPGVAQSGMMKQYIYRYHNPDKFQYLHPKMKELLEETYGVMVYQEDVIKVAHHFGGLDMAEADILRRAMSGKYRGNTEMLRIREKFFANCKQRGYSDSITSEVWRQIESFSGYSFSKAHSASFAVESYQSLYLKTYFPQEFMVAVINNFGGFYSTELYFHELKRTGANVYAPCVNNSVQLTNIHENDVYTGFVHIQNLEEKWIKKIITERERNGKYLHLHNFIERTLMPIEQLNILVRVGAFRFTGKNKKELLWEANFLQKKTRDHAPAGKALFDEASPEFKLPSFTIRSYDDALDELELLGFPLSNVFDIADEDPHRYTFSNELGTKAGKEVTVLAYLITTKSVSTVKRETMQFGTFIDVAGDWIDTIHFPDVDNRYPLQGKGFYKITGKVVDEFGVYSIEVRCMEKVGIKSREG